MHVQGFVCFVSVVCDQTVDSITGINDMHLQGFVCFVAVVCDQTVDLITRTLDMPVQSVVCVVAILCVRCGLPGFCVRCSHRL
jgi:hypothetical protein